MDQYLFENKKIIVATKHGKEKIFEKVLQPYLKGEYFTTEDFDTDQFGNFTGEIKRINSAKETVKQKCLAAMKNYKIDIGVASEGSFGNHPLYYFTSYNEEWVVLIDLKNEIEIYGVNSTSEVCYEKKIIKNWFELEEFLLKINFPNQNVIIKNKEEDGEIICKDMQNYDELKKTISKSKLSFPLYIETDLRAMNNPTRQKSIEKAVENLLKNIQSFCPKCNTPGFIVTHMERGLPCEVCGLPTKSTAFSIKTCKKCAFTQKEKTEKKYEDPQFCDFCNP